MERWAARWGGRMSHLTVFRVFHGVAPAGQLEGSLETGRAPVTVASEWGPSVAMGERMSSAVALTVWIRRWKRL